MDTQNLLAALDVGQTDVDLTVKAARAQQRLVQNVRAVRGSHDDDAIVGVEAVHLDQQLVQGLLALIVTAAETCAALTAHRVDLIDEDDGRHRLFGLFKQVAHTGGTDADVHLDEIGTGNRVERHTGLTGTGTGQQRFAGTRRADKQYAVRNACAKGVELVRGLQELNDLLQLGLFLIGTGHIGKGCLALVLLLIFDLGAAYIHDAAARAAAVHRHEQHTDAAEHCDVEDDLQPGNARLGGDVVKHHRRIRVGRVVLVNKIGDLAGVEVAAVGQLVGHIDGAAVGGQGVIVRAVHTGQQTAGGQTGCSVGLRQSSLTLLEPQLQAAGAKVQTERCHLLIFKVIVNLGVGRVLAAGRCQQRRKADDEQDQHHQDGYHEDAAEFRLFLLQEINSYPVCTPGILSFAGIYFRLKNTHIGQVAVLFVVVQTIADHELIRHFKAAVVRLDVGHAAAGLAEDGADLHAAGVAHFQHRNQLGQRDAGVQNILNDQHILAGQVGVQVLDDLDKARGGRVGTAVAGNDHKVDGAGNLNRAHQVRHKDDGTLQD